MCVLKKKKKQRYIYNSDLNNFMQLCVRYPPRSFSHSSGRRAGFRGGFQRPSVLRPLPACFTAVRERVNSHSLRVYIIIKARLHGRLRRCRRRRILIRDSAPRRRKTRLLILRRSLYGVFNLSLATPRRHPRFISVHYVNNASLLCFNPNVF